MQNPTDTTGLPRNSYLPNGQRCITLYPIFIKNSKYLVDINDYFVRLEKILILDLFESILSA
jgi:hypothetical protein